MITDLNEKQIQVLEQSLKEAASEVIANMSGLNACTKEITEIKPTRYASVLMLCGLVNGHVIVSADDHSLRYITSYVTGLEEDVLTESVMQDCLGEMANIVSGAVKSRLNAVGLTFMLSTPFFISSNSDINISFKKSATTFCISAFAENISVNLRIVII